MHNDLFSIGPFTVHGYGLMIAIGILTAYLLAEYQAKKKGLNDNLIFSLLIWCVIGGFLGSKILFTLTQLPAFIEDPSTVIGSLMNGWVVYGGILGGILGGMICCRRHNEPFLKYFDLLVPLVAMAQGFGRIGCFLAGCCYGIETNSAISVVFHNSEFAPNGVHLVPTQLISSGLDFLHFAFLLWVAKKVKADGQVAAVYLICYSIGRYIVEMFRGDIERGSVGTFSTSQFISFLILAVGIIMFFVFGRRQRTNE